MLFWHKHNIEKSLADLPNFTPFPDEWTVEDKVLFEQAFSFHGKSFHRIQQMVKTYPNTPRPHPPIPEKVTVLGLGSEVRGAVLGSPEGEEPGTFS